MIRSDGRASLHAHRSKYMPYLTKYFIKYLILASARNLLLLELRVYRAFGGMVLGIDTLPMCAAAPI